MSNCLILMGKKKTDPLDNESLAWTFQNSSKSKGTLKVDFSNSTPGTVGEQVMGALW